MLYSYDVLRNFVLLAFQRLGVSQEEAETVSSVLLEADLRGIESHGIARLRRYYTGLKEGYIRAKVQPEIIRETQVSATIDGKAGLGQVISCQAMELAIEKARKNFLGFVAVKNSNHFGIAGYYSMMALKEGMVGVCTTNSEACTVPTFGAMAMLGTNPLSLAIPAGKDIPFVLDMATSVVPLGKLEVKRRLGQEIPPGWAVDEKGDPTQDPNQVITNIYSNKKGGLLPLGGEGEILGGHKGYGLALAVEIFSALFSGGLFSRHTYPKDNKGNSLPPNIGHFFGAIRIDAFRNLSDFEQDMEDLLCELRTSPRKEGQKRIYVHGEKEWLEKERRLKEGIFLPKVVEDDLSSIASDLGLSFPS